MVTWILNVIYGANNNNNSNIFILHDAVLFMHVLCCAMLTLRAYLSIWQIFVHMLLYWRDNRGLWSTALLRERERKKKKMKKESEQKIYECFMGRQLVAIKICKTCIKLLMTLSRVIDIVMTMMMRHSKDGRWLYTYAPLWCCGCCCWFIFFCSSSLHFHFTVFTTFLCWSFAPVSSHWFCSHHYDALIWFGLTFSFRWVVSIFNIFHCWYHWT